MSQYIYHCLVGSALLALILMLCGGVVGHAWKVASRQMRGTSFAIFILCAFVATLEAQKRQINGDFARAGQTQRSSLISPTDQGSQDETQITNLTFRALNISNDMVRIDLDWPDGMFDSSSTIDLFYKRELTNNWLWAQSSTIGSAQTNLVFSLSAASLLATNSLPSSLFFAALERSSICSGMEDFDGDGVPNVYELAHGTNPFVSDAQLLTKVRLLPSTTAQEFQIALTNSASYSIIDIEPQTIIATEPIVLPAHPVLVTSDNGRAVIRSRAAIGAFLLADGQDEETLIRNLYVSLEARSGFQSAFWCGGNLPWSGVVHRRVSAISSSARCIPVLNISAGIIT